MRILFLHQNFPGQFRHLARHLAADATNQVVALGQAQAQAIPGVKLIRYKSRRDARGSTHHYLRGIEGAVLAGQATAGILSDLRKQGFTPDIVIAHPGWGESLYVKDVFPACKLIHYCEYYYHAEGADAGFDPEYPLTLDDRARIRTRNMLHLLNLEQCDIAVSPTQWQKSLHPEIYHDKIQVIHEGVDTHLATPDAHATVTLPDGHVLTRQQKVVTYVARNLEPYRGFPQFMRALTELQQARNDVHALIVGGDEVSYGSKPKGAANWREKMLGEVTLDPARTHFLGKLPYRDYLRVLQTSGAHVYLTYPFVLSWSLLEAMAAGCPLIASDTAPVREAIRHGEHGWLVDFFDTDALVNQLHTVLDTPDAQLPLRSQAREHVQTRYSLTQGRQAWLTLLNLSVMR